jgi:hypothetical protein
MFKQEHENHIYGFVDDCDRRIKMAQRKLEKTPEENRKTVDLVSRHEFRRRRRRNECDFWPMIRERQLEDHCAGWKLDT